MKYSRYCQERISFEDQVIKLAPGVNLDKERESVHQLASLAPNLRRTLLRSHGEETLEQSVDKQRSLLAVGVPIVWAYISLENGVHTGYPGWAGTYPDGYDPRVRPWYRRTLESGSGPHWGSAYVDSVGMGLLVACTSALHRPSGEFVGVAGVDVSIAYVIREFMAPKAFAEVAEAWLIDNEGRVVMRSSLLDQETSEYKLENFEDTELLEIVRARETGHVEIRRSGANVLAAFATMDMMGWTYLVMGPSDAILR